MAIAMYMVLLYSCVHGMQAFSFDSLTIILFILGLVAYLLSMLLVHWTAQENDLTQKSTYTIVLFAGASLVLSDAMISPRILWAHLFVLLGIKNILAVHNQKKVKSVILNASLWIAMASVAYFWSILFMGVVYIGILYFCPKDYRNWMIPIVAVCTVYILSTVGMLWINDSFFYLQQYVAPISFDYTHLWEYSQLIPMVVVGVSSVIFAMISVTQFSKKTAKTKPMFAMVFVQLLIAWSIVLLAPNKNTASCLFATAPLAIMGTAFLENYRNRLVKEISLWAMIIVPLFLYVLL